MIDISILSEEHILRLAGVYLHATFVFRVEPVEASEKKQKKIIKWICNQYVELVHELPEEANVFSSDNSAGDILLALQECDDLRRKLEKEREDRTENDLSTLDAASKAAIKYLLEMDQFEIGSWPKINIDGNNVKIITDDTSSFRRILTLKNIGGFPQGREGCFCQDIGIVFQTEKGRFCIYGELEDPINETSEPFGLTFDDAEVEVHIYNPCNDIFFMESPWDYLKTICGVINLKFDLPGDYCNTKEKELLPLIKEIVALNHGLHILEQESCVFFELRKLIRKYGCTDAEALINKLEKVKAEDDAAFKIINKLTTVLCEKQCEPLWREIYNKISESQAGYPDKVESLCDAELLSGVRNEIQTLMESKGYIGTYPDFIKKGALEGIRLEHSYNMTYFVGMEKMVRYHIHCFESFDEDNQLSIKFLCGTAFLKKGEPETDVYDCLFNARGRRLFRTVYHSVLLRDQDSAEANDLETSVNIAVKKAECIKLNKDEQKAFYGESIPGWGTFLWIFFIGGGLFGITMTLIGMIFCIIATAAFGMFSDIPEMLRIMPWGLILAMGWIGFGGAMGIVEVLAHRK